VGVYDSKGLYHERQFPFYFATCLLVAMILTGSMAERSRLEVLIGFIILLQCFVYPIAMNWTWNLQGGYLRNLGFFDRGGSVVIF
jgi:ammonia channel protein AmtB